jgi:catechol 2,3-dioxygenase-like lactoylglutathione lyase family enzyme
VSVSQQPALQDSVMAERIYGMHHIGITVPDIEQGIAFFEAVFGAVTVFRTGPFNVDEAFMQRKLGAAPHTRIRDLVFLRCGDGPSVELFEYSGEDSTARPKRVSEVGGTHLCFEVDDVFASAERLRAKGIEFLEGPNTVEEGPLAGFNWIYLNTPWGQTLEIASFSSLGYEKSTPQRLLAGEGIVAAAICQLKRLVVSVGGWGVPEWRGCLMWRPECMTPHEEGSSPPRAPNLARRL